MRLWIIGSGITLLLALATAGLAMLEESSGRIRSHEFPGGAGRWEIRRRRFREGGRPHELLVISDLSHALREEERQAWRRLVRVIGHELNNSLAPIRSTAATLRKLIHRDPLPPDWRDDTQAGLGIVHDRAESLSRFMGAYARRHRSRFGRHRARSLGCAGRRPVDRCRKTTAQVSLAPTASGCRSSRPSPAARALVSPCRARSSRTTAGPSRSRIVPMRAVVSRA